MQANTRFTALLLCFFIMSCQASKRVPNAQYDLNNTTWEYSDEDLTYEITFLEQGKIKSTHPNERTPLNDFWSQKGKKVFFDYNDKYATYKGIFKQPDLIMGKGSNKRNSWTYTLKRIQ